ncbi:MAG: nucleotidyltransferase domain-containing protein [Actinobacteria bacterium]|nr:nucleotidyltransferase domain-containing protein [Actinomycetota bacterium]
MKVEAVLATYLEVVDSVAPGLVEGLYVVGSYALNDWVDGASDIDIVAVTAEPATDDDFELLRSAHAKLSDRQPKPDIDGPYLAWGDLLIEPATGLHRPWKLGDELHHDGDCFEINPVLWFSLAKYGIAVRGPDPRILGIPTDTEARIRWVVGNLQTYWSAVARQVDDACRGAEPATFETAAFVWCVLGSLRLHYTAFTGDVTSKRGAGEHGLRVAATQFHPTIRAAMAHRAAGELGEVSAEQMQRAASLIRWCTTEVTEAVSKPF